VVEKIVSLGMSISLEVDSEDVEELVEDHNAELWDHHMRQQQEVAEELRDHHMEQQQEVNEELTVHEPGGEQ
jgi:prefoldin subunit 5